MLFAATRRSLCSFKRKCKTAALNSNSLSAILCRRGGGGNFDINLPLISFFEFRWLVDIGELDGVIVVEAGFRQFTKNVVQNFKLYKIPHVGIICQGPLVNLYWLDPSKVFLPRLEADITDKCNLKCSACFHFANFSLSEDFYPLEIFRKDIEHITQMCDIPSFRLMGGEPLLLKNLDEYIKILRQGLPKADLRILTNGLLIPFLQQKVLDAIRENKFVIDISMYPPTLKIADKIKAVLDKNKISYAFSSLIEKFDTFMTLNPNNAPEYSRTNCGNEVCRTIYCGKIYKCPLDAFSHKFAKKFGIENFSKSVGVDIECLNFSTLLQRLDDEIELCHWCSGNIRQIPWHTTNNPQITDWLADPEEIKKLQ